MLYLGNTKISNVTFVGSMKLPSIIDGSLVELTEEDFEAVDRVTPYVFRGRTNLTTVSIGNGVVTIGSYAFSHNDKLYYIKIPDSVETIESFAFGNSAIEFREVYIGSGIKTIERNAFSVDGSSKTLVLHISSKIPPTIQTSSFPSTATNLVRIYVPSDSLETYKNDTNWSAFYDKIFSEDEYNVD